MLITRICFVAQGGAVANDAPGGRPGSLQTLVTPYVTPETRHLKPEILDARSKKQLPAEYLIQAHF